MRLKDADALTERFKAGKKLWFNVDEVLDEISDAPTVEAEPVKHGKWVNIYGWVHCSVCHQEPPNESNIESDYCPNCGAKM